MSHALIVEALRSPRGRGNDKGALRNIKPVDLLAQQLQALAQRLYLVKKQILETYPREFKSHSGSLLHEGSDGVVSWGQLQAVMGRHCGLSAAPTAPATPATR